MTTPLRRHPALHNLSSEHHDGLVLCLRVSSWLAGRPSVGAPPDAASAREMVLRAYADKLLPHFRAEEEVLIAAALGRSEEGDALIREVLGDHARLHHLVYALEGADDGALPAALGAFATTLEAHIRLEERRWFQALQASLQDGDWDRVGPRLLERATPASCALKG